MTLTIKHVLSLAIWSLWKSQWVMVLVARLCLWHLTACQASEELMGLALKWAACFLFLWSKRLVNLTNWLAPAQKVWFWQSVTPVSACLDTNQTQHVWLVECAFHHGMNHWTCRGFLLESMGHFWWEPNVVLIDMWKNPEKTVRIGGDV